MTKFLDGPAAGVTLMLQRAPTCLRVVRSAKGWDALDQLTDEVKPGETVYVYRRVGGAGWVHLSCRPRSKSGYFVVAQYRHVPEAPAHPALSDNGAWRDWTLANRALMEAEAT